MVTSLESEMTKVFAKETFSLIKSSLAKLGQNNDEINIKIESHIKESLNWSSSIQFFGMSNPHNIDEKSIELDINLAPRKFRENSSNGELLNEENILSDSSHFILLGSPGSGKTTTIKRLVRTVLTMPPTSKEDIYQYPIVIRLRELKKDESIFHHIAKVLGIKIRQEIIESRGIEGKKVKNYYYYIGKDLIEDAIPNILDQTKAILFIDGLDEIPKNYKKAIESEATALARKLLNSKIIMSCRSGDYSTHIEGFSVVELCDLTKEQIDDIASKWADSPEEFIKEISSTPYKDLSNRPLLLTQLITLFNKNGYLPDLAIDVYGRIIRLLIDDWDQNRKIIRKSKYASFSLTEKEKFLSALSFELTYKQKTNRFDVNNLLESYLSIYKKFNLDKNEAELVIEEIESHTGLIIKSGYSFFEFSHLSLQEYLCANYLVRSPISKNISLYLKEYPAPLAIAIALSTEPGAWFSMVILSDYESDESKLVSQNLYTLLDRLNLEGIEFEESSLLGFALLKLATLSYQSENNKFKGATKKLLKKKQSIKSIRKVLNLYTMDSTKENSDVYYLSRRCGILNQYELEAPVNPTIPIFIIDALVRKNELKMTVNSYDENTKYFEEIFDK